MYLYATHYTYFVINSPILYQHVAPVIFDLAVAKISVLVEIICWGYFCMCTIVRVMFSNNNHETHIPEDIE